MDSRYTQAVHLINYEHLQEMALKVSDKERQKQLGGENLGVIFEKKFTRNLFVDNCKL